MLYIIIIIAGFIVIGLIKDYVTEHWKWVLLLLAIICSFILAGPIGGCTVILLLILVYFIREQIMKSNEKKLINYLRDNCVYLGQISDQDYDSLTPGFREKTYKTSFREIVSTFVSENERLFISNNVHVIDPAIEYIRSHIMADMQELMALNYPGLSFTHSTANVEIIANGLKTKCGQNLEFSIIKLQEDNVKQELARKGIIYSDYYLNAYKLNGSELLSSDNFESEELSIEDL